MDEDEIALAAKFLIDRRGVTEAKEWAARQSLEVGDAEARATWLRILQAIIDMYPSGEAKTPLN